jgi:hypothetical protein
MTDNEIIKALEKVLNNSDEPIGEHWMVFITTQLAKDTYDALIRQMTTIKSLIADNKEMTKYYQLLNDVRIDDIKKAKSEAIKKFVEQAIKGANLYVCSSGQEYVSVRHLKKLAKKENGRC